MITLTNTPRKVSNNSWLCRPVAANAAGFGDMDKQDMVAFWLAYSFAFDDTEPLPSTFRRKALTVSAETPSAIAELEGKLSAAARLFKFHISTTAARISKMARRMSHMTAIYVLASLLFFCVAVDVTLLTITSFSPERAAATWSAPENNNTLKTAALFSSSSIESVQDSQAPGTKRTENDQVLGRLEAWVNAGTVMSGDAAKPCAASSLNCWQTFIR
jgi:hypothetical protein